MEKTKFNFAFVFSIVALLGFAYFAFMGLVYWKNGDLVMPAILTAAGIVLVLVCLFVMCKGKSSRWTIGKIGEVLFGIIILGTLLAAALPFTNFFKVVEQQDKIKTEIKAMFSSAESLDSAYNAYCTDRLEAYERTLKVACKGKTVRPKDYLTLVANAGGNDDEQKVDNLVKSLKRQLTPESMDSVHQKRAEWLESTGDMSVWNLKFPNNVNVIANQVKDYSENYAKLSQKIRKGEHAEPFSYPAFSSNLQQLQSNYTTLHFPPTVLSLVVALIAFLIILLPYFITEGSLADKGGNMLRIKQTGAKDYE